jgi:phage terminase small subunit
LNNDKNGIRERIEELRLCVSQAAVTRAAVDREFVLSGLKENFERAMQHEPVLNAKGVPTGEYRYNGAVACRSLELLGKELGMFIDRKMDVPADPSEWDSATWDAAMKAMAAKAGVSLEEMHRAADELDAKELEKPN